MKIHKFLVEIQHYFPEKFWGQMCVCDKFADSAQRKRVSLNKFTERYKFLLISLPKRVVGEVPRSIPEVSHE